MKETIGILTSGWFRLLSIPCNNIVIGLRNYVSGQKSKTTKLSLEKKKRILFLNY